MVPIQINRAKIGFQRILLSFGISRTLRKIAETRDLRAGFLLKLQDKMNRWRKTIETADGRNPRLLISRSGSDTNNVALFLLMLFEVVYPSTIVV